MKPSYSACVPSSIRCVVTFLIALTTTCVTAHDFVNDATVTPLMNETLTELPGRVGSMIIVEYPPGGRTGKHRHPGAYTFVYVLEGEVEMQVDGGPVVRLGVGQTYFETPDDIHTVSRNVSADAGARFLVVFIQEAGKPPVEPVE